MDRETTAIPALPSTITLRRRSRERARSRHRRARRRRGARAGRTRRPVSTVGRRGSRTSTRATQSRTTWVSRLSIVASFSGTSSTGPTTTVPSSRSKRQRAVAVERPDGDLGEHDVGHAREHGGGQTDRLGDVAPTSQPAAPVPASSSRGSRAVFRPARTRRPPPRGRAPVRCSRPRARPRRRRPTTAGRSSRTTISTPAGHRRLTVAAATHGRARSCSRSVGQVERHELVAGLDRRWRPRRRPRCSRSAPVTTISSTSRSGLNSTPIAAATTATSTTERDPAPRRRARAARGPHGDVRRCEVRPGCAPPDPTVPRPGPGGPDGWSSVDAAGAPGPRCDRVRRSRGGYRRTA